jgi:hypothetical protein
VHLYFDIETTLSLNEQIDVEIVPLGNISAIHRATPHAWVRGVATKVYVAQ